jgi:hypothetical protein
VAEQALEPLGNRYCKDMHRSYCKDMHRSYCKDILQGQAPQSPGYCKYCKDMHRSRLAIHGHTPTQQVAMVIFEGVLQRDVAIEAENERRSRCAGIGRRRLRDPGASCARGFIT